MEGVLLQVLWEAEAKTGSGMQEVYWEKIPVKDNGEGTGGDRVSFQTTMQACTCKRIWEKKEGCRGESQTAVQLSKFVASGSVVKNPLTNAVDSGDMGSIPGSGRSHGEGNGNTPVFLPGEAQGQRTLVGYRPWGCRESDMPEHAHTAHSHNRPVVQLHDCPTSREGRGGGGERWV